MSTCGQRDERSLNKTLSLFSAGSAWIYRRSWSAGDPGLYTLGALRVINRPYTPRAPRLSVPIFIICSRSAKTTMSSIHKRQALRVHRMPESLTQRQNHRMPSIPESTILRTESDMSAAETPGAPQQAHGERDTSAHRGQKKAQTTWHQVRDWPAQEWPAHREARGDLTLKNSPDSRRAGRAVCTIQHGVLRFSFLTSRGERTSACAEAPVEHLAVGLQRARPTMLTIARVHEDIIYDEICCFADDHATRNKWTGIFRRLGVPIFDQREMGHADALFP